MENKVEGGSLGPPGGIGTCAGTPDRDWWWVGFRGYVLPHMHIEFPSRNLFFLIDVRTIRLNYRDFWKGSLC